MMTPKVVPGMEQEYQNFIEMLSSSPSPSSSLYSSSSTSMDASSFGIGNRNTAANSSVMAMTLNTTMTNNNFPTKKSRSRSDQDYDNGTTYDTTTSYFTNNNNNSNNNNDNNNNSSNLLLPDPKDVDALLAQEMNNMTLEERDEAFLDVHCIKNDTIVETPQFLADSIRDLYRSLENIPYAQKEAYFQALQQNATFIHNIPFVLRFLRAGRFQAMDAAERLVGYLQSKKQLWGVDKLTKHITLQDFTEDDKRCLECGIMHILPKPDRGGRAVFFWNMMLRGTHSRLSKQRVQFYGQQVALESQLQTNAQQSSQPGAGLVVVTCNFGHNKMPVHEMELAFQNPAMVTMHSARCVAFHFCLDKEDNRRISSAIMKLVGKRTRARFRTHHGTIRQIKDSLKTFGIPVDVLPVADEGKYLFENHKKWLQQRYFIEGAPMIIPKQPQPQLSTPPPPPAATTITGTTTTATIVEKEENESDNDYVNVIHNTNTNTDANDPGDWDIVCGKGKQIQELKGNVRFRNLVKACFHRYESLGSYKEKTLMVIEILQYIQDQGGRFVKQIPDTGNTNTNTNTKLTGNGKWEEVDPQVAHKKVATAFHSLRRSNKRRKMEQQSSSEQ